MKSPQTKIAFRILLSVFAIIGFIASVLTIYPMIQNYYNNQNARIGIIIVNQQNLPQYHSLIIYNYGNKTSNPFIFTVSTPTNSIQLNIVELNATNHYFINNTYFDENPNTSIAKIIDTSGRYSYDVELNNLPKDKFVQFIVFNSTLSLDISQVNINYCISTINETLFSEASGNIFIPPKNGTPINLYVAFTNLGPSCIKPDWLPLPFALYINSTSLSYVGKLLGLPTLNVNQSLQVGVATT